MSREISTDAKYITRKQLAEILQVSIPTTYRYQKQKLYPAYGIGGKVLFRLDEVENALTRIN